MTDLEKKIEDRRLEKIKEAQKRAIDGDDFFREMSDYNDRRFRELLKWKRHHEACLEEINKEIEKGTEIDRIYNNLINKLRGIGND